MKKGENAGKQHFPLFPQYFLAISITNFKFSAKVNLSSANAFNLDWSKNLLCVNPSPEDNMLGLPKLKAFADDKINVTENIKVVFHRIGNIAGNEENAGYQHFLLFPQCFQKTFSSSASKVVIMW